MLNENRAEQSMLKYDHHSSGASLTQVKHVEITYGGATRLKMKYNLSEVDMSSI